MCDIVSFFYGCVDVLTIVPVLLCICLLEKGYKNVISVVDDCERQLMEIMFGKGMARFRRSRVMGSDMENIGR